MIQKYLSLSLLLFVLTGCDDSQQVNEVKDIVYAKLDKTIAVGNALNNRDICQKINWSSYKDNKDRNIVEYTCQLKLEQPSQFLGQLIDNKITNIKQQYIDSNITITPDSFEAFKREVGKSVHSASSQYANYINAEVPEYIYAKYSVYQYETLISALKEIAKTPAWKRYQENMSYFTSHQKEIEALIVETAKMKGYSSNSYEVSSLIKQLYALKGYSLINKNFDYFDITSSGWKEDNKWDYNNKLSQVHKLSMEIGKDIETIRANMMNYSVYFNSMDDGSYEYNRYVKVFERIKVKDGAINLSSCNECKLIFDVFLSGDKERTISLKDDSEEITVNNYQDFADYLLEEERETMTSIKERIIDPYNAKLMSQVEYLQKLKNKPLINHYEQKIQWSLIKNQVPALLNCDLLIKSNDSPEIKLEQNVEKCLEASYSEHYEESLYNQPIWQLFDVIYRE